MRHRAGLLLAILAFGLAALALGWHGRRERMLLDHATVVIPAPQYVGGPYYWLSDGRILMARDFADGTGVAPACYVWSIAARSRTRDESLTAALRGVNSETLRASPDGRWLLTEAVETHRTAGPPERFYYVCASDGSVRQRHDAGDRFKGVRWLADARHWIELYGRHVLTPAMRRRGWTNLNDAPIRIERLRVCCVPDGRAAMPPRDLTVPPSAALAALGIERRLFPVSTDRYLVWNQRFAGSQSVVTIEELDRTSAAPVRQHNVTLPVRAGVVQLVFTPRGDRILWKLRESRPPGPGVQLAMTVLGPFLPAPRPHGVERTSLWVSEADGSKLHELGGVNNDVPAPHMVNGPTDPETGEHLWGPAVPRLVRWAPDGRRCSFVYGRALWTVPAD